MSCGVPITSLRAEKSYIRSRNGSELPQAASGAAKARVNKKIEQKKDEAKDKARDDLRDKLKKKLGL